MLNPPATNSLNELLRKPAEVMNLKRMGSAHQCRLSFMRSLLRMLKREQWQFVRSHWDIDELGVGHAVYQAKGPERSYSLVAFGHNLADEKRSDRVIADAWDATFTLFDGIPNTADIERLKKNVPLQEAGRITEKEISLARANRSSRMFQFVVNALAQGQQPEPQTLEEVGYLMRTTAVYGSGKFGAADYAAIAQRPELGAPFRAEMLHVWLIRAFTVDLVEHLASVKGKQNAVKLDPKLRRSLGVGNSTGLGMAPFLVNHPRLINNWILAREQALARVRNLKHAESDKISDFKIHLLRAKLNVQQWHSDHPLQQQKLEQLRQDLVLLSDHLRSFDFNIEQPWQQLYLWAESNLTLEGQEQLAMLMLEPYGQLIDDLTESMSADESELPMIQGQNTVADLRHHLESFYDWAVKIDFSDAARQAKFWYVSEEKLEPRLGQRFCESGSELEQPLGIGRIVSNLHQDLLKTPAPTHLAEFLQDHPEHRQIVRRVQLIKDFPYMEIQDNLLDEHLLPIDMLRLKLSFFGATKFDPRSDRWIRINMFQHAPFPHELHELQEDDWIYPPMESS